MNKEIVEGKLDKASGAIKQSIGETVGNQKLANAGVADQIKGAAKETWGKAKDVAADSRDNAAAETELKRESLKQRVEDAAHNLRAKLVEETQHAKDTISEKLDEIRDRTDRG
jgi:uncharacterized protein YjbJ (UPF0337 family)